MRFVFALLVSVLFATSVLSQEEAADLNVLYVGDPRDGRPQEFKTFLESHFAKVETASRTGFQIEVVDSFQVVLLDWSQWESKSGTAVSPFGSRDEWDVPTLLVGSGGHLLAGPWRVLGGLGCTCLSPYTMVPDQPHEVFHQPRPLDLTSFITKPAPDSWGRYDAQQVKLIAIGAEPENDTGLGWATYPYEFERMPEVEWICAGWNQAMPEAAAVWRQGNLLHFGFEPAPSQLTPKGRRLLVNSIVYISRFTEDRPIAETPSPFRETAPTPRFFPIQWLENSRRSLIQLSQYFEKNVLPAAAFQDRESALQWIKENYDWLRPGTNGRLTIDPLARKWGVPFDDPKFFQRVIPSLANDKSTKNKNIAGEEALTLLHRFVHKDSRPSVDSKAVWETWWEENRSYLFFSELGGFHWYIDPLAKKRGIPTQNLRGPDRASPSTK